MSSSGDDPRTPDRRTSSSTLFSAFKNLTRGSLRSPTPPPAVSSTTAFPARRSILGVLLPSDAVQSAPAVPAAGGPAQGGLNPKQAPQGGPKELDHLVAQLHVGRPLQLRIAAVEQIVQILKKYPVRNVLGLWTEASDLVLAEQAGETREAGYKLLRSCAALPDLSFMERNVFFAAACVRQGANYLDVRLDIISTITNGGRNVNACEALVPAFVLESLEDCFKESLAVPRKAQNGKRIAQDSVGHADKMSKLFQYIIDVCKFNSKLLNDDDLCQLLGKTMDICEKTYTRSDIANAIRLFDTIIVYVHIPSSALGRCLDVLCSIYCKLPELQELTWNVLSNLFRSHFGQAAVAALLRTVANGSSRKIRDSTPFRGAIKVLQLLLLEDPRNGLPKVPLSLLIPALKSTMKEHHASHEKRIVRLLCALLDDERVRHMLLNEANWIDLIDIIRTCAGREGMVDMTAGPAVTAAGTGGASASVTSTGGDVDNDTNSNFNVSTGPTRSESISRNPDEDIHRVLSGLFALSHDVESIQRAEIMGLLMQLSPRLDDSMAEDVMRFYIEERLFYPSNESWLESCRTLVSGILTDRNRPRSLRNLCIRTLRDTYAIVESVCPSDTVLQCGALLLTNIEAEEDVEVLYELVEFAVEVIDHASDTSFHDALKVLRRGLEHHKYRMQNSNAPPNPVMISSSCNPRPVDHPLGSPCNVIATAFVRLFIRCVGKSARKTRVLYEDVRHIVGCDSYDSDARLTALKLLFRLRAESNHALLVSSSSEGESIAAVLCRTSETALAVAKSEDTTQSDGPKAEEASWREQRKISGTSPHSSLNRNTGRQTTVPGRVAKPVPPLWMYPGPKGLPEEPLSRASRVVFSHINPEEYPLPDDILDLEVTLWLELVIVLLQQKAPDWEIYSYVIVHLGPQLSNQALVRSCVAQLRMLRNVVCEQLRNASFCEPPSYTLLKKADVAVCLFHILTVLLSYHDYFEKSEEDDVVKTFLHGIGSWDRTSIWCIHALTVCCHETPLSVSKSLDNIIQKMSQIITKPSTAIHILEFLTFVARMPELYKNFREEEFKMVFGVSFRYIQHVRDQRQRASATSGAQGTHRALRHSGASRDFSSPDRHSRPYKSAADDLPQYVYSLAYHVITFWFISLKMEDRPKQIPWITQRLLYTDSSGKQVMEEQGHVIVDMMHNLAWTDSGETVRDDSFAKPSDGEVWRRTWIAGHSLITIETATRTGVSQITSRRPCGTRYMYTRPLLAPPPRHQVPLVLQLESKDFHSTSDVAIVPEDIFQTYFAPLDLTDPPIPLPNDNMTKRSIEMFDRNATVDGHKVGVIYIGEGQMGQSCERAILLNNIGSAAYTSFLNDLGTQVRLKGAQFNTGGLDRRDDMDGEFTYCWRDRVMELVFHITTMMPPASDIDMTYANKKRHIGNDYVNIIFNDSGLPYDYETFPSQFNYVAIVITPESRASFVDRRLNSDPGGKSRYYKVQVMSKPGFPDISPAVEPKILCGKHLAAYCRLLAINASVFSQVWAIRDGGESISSWRNRLREIKRLRERYGAGDLSMVSGPSSPAHEYGVSSPPPRENTPSAASFKRTSVTTFMSESTNRSSLTSPSHDAPS